MVPVATAVDAGAPAEMEEMEESSGVALGAKEVAAPPVVLAVDSGARTCGTFRFAARVAWARSAVRLMRVPSRAP